MTEVTEKNILLLNGSAMPNSGRPPHARRLPENALFPQLFVICKILSSEYQLYACGKIVQMPQFEKKLLFSDKLLGVDKKTL